MTLRFVEEPGSRKFSKGATGAKLTLSGIIYRTYDETEVDAFIIAETFEIADNLLRSDWDAEHVGGGIWKVTINYGANEQKGTAGTPTGTTPETPTAGPSNEQNLFDPNLGMEFSVDLSAQTVNVKQSLVTTAYDLTGESDPPDYQGAINVSKDGVAGVDAYQPHSEFTVTQKRATFSLTDYRRLRSLTGTVNAYDIWGFPTGELLYLGATVQGTERGQCTLSHKFATEENFEDIEISEDVVIPKNGWDYVWFAYAKDEDEDSVSVVSRPVAAFVESIYFRADHGDIGIGV